MKKTALFILAVCAIIGIFAIAAYWMDQLSYVNKPSLPEIDPASVGASLRADEIPAGEGPVLIVGNQSAQEESNPVPVPFFWMAVGALCAGFGVLIATRERKPKYGRYSIGRN